MRQFECLTLLLCSTDWLKGPNVSDEGDDALRSIKSVVQWSALKLNYICYSTDLNHIKGVNLWIPILFDQSVSLLV